MRQIQQNDRYHDPVIRLLIVLIFLCSNGFPGNLTAVIGNAAANLYIYGTFLIEIALVVFSSGNSFMDIKLIDLKKNYNMIYIFLAVISAISMVVAKYKSDELISIVHFSVTAFLSIWLAEHYNLEEILEMYADSQWLMCLICLAESIVFPDISHSNENNTYNLTGFYTTKNPLGNVLAFGAVMIIVLLVIKRMHKKPLQYKYIILAVLQLVMIVMTNTMTAIVTVVITSAFIIMIANEKMPRIQLGVLYTVVSVGFIVFSQTILPMMTPIFDMLGKDATLTNRTPFWKQIIYVMSNHNTFTGYGFSMFWKNEEAVELFHSGFEEGTFGSTMTFGCHNSLLELWVDIGIIGLVFFFLMIIIALHDPKSIGKETYIFCFGVMVVLTIRGLTERSFTTYNYLSRMLFLVVALASTDRVTQKMNGEGIGTNYLSH